jgi:protein-S-isoprenylcysteine O-methyltransferase Ste14
MRAVSPVLDEAPGGAPPDRTTRTLSRGGVVAVSALAVVFTAGLTFVTIELPERLTSWADRWIDIPDYHPVIEPEAINQFLSRNYIRPIGYACLAVVLGLIGAGLVTRRHSLSKVGAVLLFLPTFGFFAAYMFFLAGLGVLRALWLPIWSGWLALGDIAYVPYMAIVWPLWQTGLDARHEVAFGAIAIGLLVFTVATGLWLVARARGRNVVDFWLYRYTRHPQYLGWILWSYGVMLLAGLEPVPMGGENPGAALPWVVATLVIVAVAWAEEARMLEDHGADYAAYRRRTPFLLPVPPVPGRPMTTLLRWVIGTDAPATRGEIILAFALYLGLAVLLSVPFMVFEWPRYGWWGWPV